MFPVWYSKFKVMLVISIREFREKQGKYIDMVNNGEDIVLKSRDKGSFKLTKVTEDDSLVSKEEFFARVDKAIQQAEEGKVKKIKSIEEIDKFLGL